MDVLRDGRYAPTAAGSLPVAHDDPPRGGLAREPPARQLLQVQVQAQGVVHRIHDRSWDPAEHRTESLHRDGSHLFGLRLGVDAQAGQLRQQAGGSRLSAREKEILAGVAAGKTLAVIGGELSLSTATVKTYLHRAYDKLGVSDRAAAVAKAFQQGLL